MPSFNYLLDFWIADGDMKHYPLKSIQQTEMHWDYQNLKSCLEAAAARAQEIAMTARQRGEQMDDKPCSVEISMESPSFSFKLKGTSLKKTDFKLESYKHLNPLF